MRYLTTTLLLLMASCGSRSPSDMGLIQAPAQTLATWKPSLQLADTALSGGSPAIALQVSDELLAKDPRDAGALVRRGDALTAMGRLNEAATSYKTAIEIEPRNGRALVGFGSARLPQDPPTAEALFARAASADSHNAVALSNLGVARDLQGHHGAAQEAYRLALGAAPDSVPTQVNLGLSLALSGDTDGAVRLLQPLGTEPGASPRMRHDLALSLALSGHSDKAAALLARDLRPDEVRGALDGFEALRK